MTRQVLAVRYGSRVTRKSESFLSYHAYGEPDMAQDVDYYFWVIRHDDGTATLVDTGFALEAGRRRNRDQWFTPAQALPVLGIDPGSVRTVVITHAHWDHIGNLSQFPAAEIVMSQAEYDFWMSPVARRPLFALHSEEDELSLLASARTTGRLTLTQAASTQLSPGVQLIQVGGHTPGQLIVTIDDGAGTVILASDALHHYEEADSDRPYAVLSDLPAMYRAYDLLTELAAERGARLVAGHDPLVRERFAPHPAHADACDLGTPLA